MDLAAVLGQKDGLMQWLHFLIISHTFHNWKPQSRELSGSLLHTAAHPRCLPACLFTVKETDHKLLFHHPPSSVPTSVQGIQAATRSALTLALACTFNLPNLKPEKYAAGWNTRISVMQWARTTLSSARMCIYPSLILSLLVFCLTTISLNFSMIQSLTRCSLWICQEKLWVGWAAYCKLDALIVP